ncbi:hypothetical protein SK128_009654, partial [Halocaridina rubra]
MHVKSAVLMSTRHILGCPFISKLNGLNTRNASSCKVKKFLCLLLPFQKTLQSCAYASFHQNMDFSVRRKEISVRGKPTEFLTLGATADEKPKNIILIIP